MAAIEKRIIRREITQTLVLPLDLDMSIRDQCERVLVSRLRGTPSEWGVMVEDHLLDLRVSEYVTPVSYGTKVLTAVPVKASFEVVGYILGDVLFGVSLAEKLADDPIINQFRRVDILGLPFQIDVKTRSEVQAMNIQIIDSRIEGTLQYIAVPAFYALYTPFCAHLASTTLQTTSLYAETPVVEAKSAPTQIEWQLIDPLHGMPVDSRRKRIVGEIRRVLGITPTQMATMVSKQPRATAPTVSKGKERSNEEEPKEGGAEKAPQQQQEGVLVINSLAPFDGKATVTQTVADSSRTIVIEFIEVEDVKKKMKVFEDAKCSKYTFVYVPAFLPLGTIVAAVSWYPEIQRLSAPNSSQVEQFAREVNLLVKFRKLEMASNKGIYGAKVLAGSGGNSAEAQLLREHLEAGVKLRNGLGIETIQPAVSKAAKLAEEKKQREAKARIEGKPIHIEPTKPVTTPSRRGRGRGTLADRSSEAGSSSASSESAAPTRGRGRGSKAPHS
jgi:hypothetical protein